MKRAVSFLIFALLANLCHAQQKPAPFIPSSRSATEINTEINRLNSYVYRDMLPPEVFDLITAGKVIIQADVRSEFMWNSLRAAYSPARTEENYLGKFLPYGALPDILLSGDKKKAFSEILANIESHFWHYPYWKLDFQLLWFDNDKLRRGANGIYQRVYPKLLDSNHKSLQLFRDLFLIKEPKKIANLGWLTYRFSSEDEDLYWMFSSLDGQPVNLSGANRGDALPSTNLSPDDLFGWSAKKEYTEGITSGEKNYLVPISQRKLMLLSPDSANNGCFQKTGSGNELKNTSPPADFSPESDRWNFNSKQYNAAGWSPGNQLFALRPLTELQIFSTDFFASAGRQVLYIDSENYLPYYKVIYDRSGDLAKIIITSFEAYYDNASKSPVFAPVYTLAIDKKTNNATIIEFANFKGCNALPESSKLADFDPRNYLVNEKQAAEKQPNDNQNNANPAKREQKAPAARTSVAQPQPLSTPER